MNLGGHKHSVYNILLSYLHILLCNHYKGYEYSALAIDFIFFISFNSHNYTKRVVLLSPF